MRRFVQTFAILVLLVADSAQGQTLQSATTWGS